MSKVLSIPFRVNALWLSKNVNAATASADFREVPFIDAKGLTNYPDKPFISENMVAQPFENGHQLEKGVHLHFDIPIAFKTAQKLNNDVEETYPPLPNRWLVIKNNSEKWIIESDYLWAEDNLEDAKKESITVLLPKKGIQGKTVYSRCRYLGRKYPAAEFPKATKNGNYWRDFYGGQGITAIGYGEPTFSGFYPNCKSVFGFFDESGKANDSYEIIGWYEQVADLKAITSAFSDNDELKNNLYFKDNANLADYKTTIKNLGERWKTLSKVEEKTAFHEKYEKYIFLYENGIVDLNFSDAQQLEIKYNRIKAFENTYEVSYAENKDKLFLPEQILFVSKIKVLENSKTENTHTIDNAQIAIGNTGREALNALKAQQQYNADTDQPKKQTKAQIEAALELIHFDDVIDKQVDHNFKFQQERQEKTFSHIEDGKAWTLDIKLKKSDKLSTDNKENSALKNLLNEPAVTVIQQALLQKTSDLNTLKYAYNKQSHSIKSQQHQLFVDWYKYMLTVHPPLYDSDNYLNSDEVLRFINRYVIKGIYDDISKTDVIENSTRKTLDTYKLNQDFDTRGLENLKQTVQSDSTLGKLINILFEDKDVITKEMNFHLFQSKPFFEKAIAQFTALTTGFNATNSLIAQLSKVKNKNLTLDDITSDNAQVQGLKVQKIATSFVGNWKVLYLQSANFYDLKNFFSNYQTNIPDEIKTTINNSIKRLQSVEKQYNKVLPLLEDITNLSRLDANQLLKIITLLTDNLVIRNDANTYLNQSDDSKLVATNAFINTNIKTVFENEVKATIEVESAIYNDATFDAALDSIITGLTNYIKSYFEIQFQNLAKSIKIECQALQSKIDKTQPVYKEISAILAILLRKDIEINTANIAALNTNLNTLKNRLDAITDKTVDSDYNNQKSILQLLKDFEKVIQTTIDTFEIEQTDEKGTTTIVKKYKILADKTIDTRLSLKAEPRYYESKEPVVLIEAKGLKASTPKKQNENLQALIDLSYTSFDIQTIDTFRGNDCYKNLNILTLDAAFWNPIIMDWRVEYLAVNDASIQQKYDADFVTDTFVLNDDDLELQIQQTKKLANIINSGLARVYSGSTLLSSHAIRNATEKLAQYNITETNSKDLSPSKNDLPTINNAIQSIVNEEKLPTFTNVMMPERSYLDNLLRFSEKVQEFQQEEAIAIDQEENLEGINLLIKGAKYSQFNNSINLAFGSSGLLLKETEPAAETAILSQSLGGFNQCLLMRKQTMQLEVDDPIALENYRPLVENIRDFVGGATRCAPEPRHYFNPIRSGVMQLKKLRIVDSFGQVADVKFDVTTNDTDSKIIVAETLKAKKETDEDRLEPKGYDAFLPTRIVQPLRLNLRWISNTDTSEDAESAHSSPICGWIVPNFLNTTIALFTREGDLLGDVGLVRDASDNAVIRLLPKPGAHSFYDFEITNTYLRQLAQYFVKNGAVSFNNFLKNINNTMVSTDPEGFERHTEISMLVGKPLALVLGKVGFQAMEDYAVNQGWSVFERDIKNTESQDYQRETYDFQDVKLPIKLGHKNQLNDGLFGFWLEEETEFRPVLKTEGFNANNIINKTIDEDGTLLTMLFDPRGQLNSFTGVLPAKTITIPPELYAEALKKMKIYFSVGPFITSKSKLQFPIPRSKVYEWKWVYEHDFQLTEISTKPTIEKAIFEIAWKKEFDANVEMAWKSLLENNWLQPADNNTTTAYVNFDTKTRLPLPKLEDITTDWSNKADQIINQHYKGIAPTTTDVAFGQFELREGWLKLMNEL